MDVDHRICRRIERNHLRRALLLVLWLALWADSGALAKTKSWDRPAFSVEPKELARQVSEISAGPSDGVVAALFEFEFVLHSDGRTDRRTRSIYRIVSAAAVEQNSGVDVAWRPGFQQRPRVKARVIAADGTVFHLDPESLRSYSASNAGPLLYDDVEYLRGPLPGASVDSIIEIECSVTSVKPFFPGGFMTRTSFGRRIPFQRQRLVVDAPKDLPIRFVQRLVDDVEQRTTTTRGRKRYVFEHGPRSAWEILEPSAPGDVPRYPYVAFTTAPAWAELARIYSGLVEERLSSADVSKIVRKAKASAGSRTETIAALLARLHKEVRYTGVEFGRQAIVPEYPSTTLKRRYGDCKDKAALLISMLRAAGIDAKMALLSAGFGEDINSELPGLAQFNHAIVYVPGPEPLWIDATSANARLGELPTTDQGRLALIVDPQTTGLTEIPVLGTDTNRMIETRDVYLTKRGGARIVETTEWHGALEFTNRELMSQIARHVMREQLEQYSTTELRATKLVDFELSEPTDLSRPLTLRLEVEGAEVAWAAPPRATVTIPLGGLLDGLPDELILDGESDRPFVHDVVLPTPHVKEWRYRIHPQPGYSLRDTPPDETRDFGAARLSSRFSVDESGTIGADFRLEAPRRFSPEDAVEARDAVLEFFAEDALQLTIEQRGETHLAEGRIREALEEFRALAVSAPQDADPRSQIARALLAAGFGAEARKEARRAVDLDPKSTDALRTLAQIMCHDVLGRPWERGFDPVAAEAALLDAIRMDPDDNAARIQLAELYTFNDRAEFSGSGARLEEAAEIYRQLREDRGVEFLDEAHMFVLFELGRYEEVTAIGRTSDLVGVGAAMSVAAKAMIDPTQAIREASRVSGGGRNYRELLGNAAEFLADARRYEEAAVLMRAGAKGHENAMDLLAYADVLARTKRHARPSLPAETPEDLVRSTLWIGLTSTETIDDLLRIWAQPIADTVGDAEFDKTLVDDLIMRMRGDLDRAEISVEFILDLMLSHLELSISGDDSTGYRITVSHEILVGTAEPTHVYAVRENGSYHLVATSSSLWAAGLQVRQWLDQGHNDRARAWLDWMRDELAGTPQAYPFALLWPKEDATAADLRAAAAALLIQSPTFVDRGIRTLETLRETVEGDEQIPFDETLLWASSAARDSDRVVTYGPRVLEADPESLGALYSLVGALSRLGRQDEARAILGSRLEATPDDPHAKRLLAGAASTEGDIAENRRLLRELVASGEAVPNDFNNLAWTDVVLDDITAETLEYAQRAATSGGLASTAAIHTLATVYAEMDQPAEARDILLQVVASRLSNDIEPIDSYVLGRIAESYDLKELALDAYSRVEQSATEANDRGSTAALARKRSAMLTAKTGAP
ncbi:MAG: DUF3857 domain-containing protein [bacterium]|nr:DUF3857 domain-containing protein [bacterium]